MHPQFRLAACAAAVFSSFSTNAQQVQPVRDEATVVVTADRFATPIAILPLGITIITADDIGRSTAANVPEVLAKLGGVQVRSSNAGDPNSQIDLRGFGMSGDQNTLILVDGQRVSENELVPAHLASIPLNAIERIEILHGSGAVLYGAGATSGTINIITRSPAGNRSSATLVGSTGSYGTSELRATGNVGGDTFGLALHANSYASDNYRVNNRVTDDNLEGDLRWRHSSGRMDLKFGSGRQTLGLPSARTEEQLTSDPQGTRSPNDHGTTDTWHVMLGATRDTGIGELAADLAFRNKRTNADMPANFFNSTTDMDQWNFTPRIKIRHDGPAGESEVVAGIDVYHWIYSQQSNYGAAAATQHGAALYLQEHLSLSADTQLIAGARTQNQRDRITLPGGADQSVNLSAFEIGLRQTFSDRLVAYGKWGQSFRTANVDENAYTSTGNHLLPQKSHDVEAGIEYHHGPNKVRTAWFESNIVNEIHALAIPGGTVFGFATNTNLSPTRRSGIEFEARSSPSDQLDMSVNYRLTKAEFRSGTYDGVDLSGHEVPLVPRHVLAANASWKIAEQRVASATWRYVGEQRYDNDQVNTFRMMPSYGLIDLKYRHDLRQWSWFLTVDNLFDKRYYSYAIRNDTGTSYSAYPELGRRVMLGAELRL